MVITRKWLGLAGLAGLAVIGLSVTPAGSQPPPNRRPDRGKNDVIEPSIKEIVAKMAAPVPPPSPRPSDVGKSLVIEPAVKQILAKNSTPVPPAPPPPVINLVTPNGNTPNAPRFNIPRLDVGKGGVIEPQMKQFVQVASTPAQFGAAQFVAAPAPVAPEAPKDFVNPKVEPGLVKWHKSFEEAQAAAAKTKKPVLVFQLMGKLDDQFC
jgi:hypothetical protein